LHRDTLLFVGCASESPTSHDVSIPFLELYQKSHTSVAAEAGHFRATDLGDYEKYHLPLRSVLTQRSVLSGARAVVQSTSVLG